MAIFFALFAAVGAKSYCLPRPIGPVSDYGSVLDRYGRERIASLIEKTRDHYGIAVYILASWEDPYDDINRYAVAVLDAWNLARGKTILAVFLKSRGDWDVSVVAGELATAAYPQLARKVKAEIADLVTHHRIEEAMVALFGVIERQLSLKTRVEQTRTERKGSRLLPVLLLIGSLGLAAFFIQRRVCPRCGRILRIRKRRIVVPYRRGDVIYYCQRCGYSRAKRGEG